MSKFTPLTILSEYAAVAALNSNFSTIQELLDKCIFRDGTAPNSLLANLDANHFTIKNLATPEDLYDPVRLVDLNDAIASIGTGSGTTVSGTMVIGLFGAGSSISIASDINLVMTSGFNQIGRGSAFYIYDSLVDAAFATANPGSSFVTTNGRGFRLIGMDGKTINPFMFGAVDCTGTPRLADEAVFDCSDAMEHMWLYVKTMNARNIPYTMDWSMARGLGLTRTWVLSHLVNQSIWNRPTFNVIPGRLVALSRMTDMVSLQGGNFQNQGGIWELWAGTDTQLNAGDYGARLAKNGIKIFGCAGSRMGDVFCQGFQRFAIAYDHSTDPNNNNIPMQWGRVIAIQCGTRNIDNLHKPAGTYTDGSWLNHPTDNYVAQAHLMTFPLPDTIDPGILEVGDAVLFGTPGDDTDMTVGIVGSIEGTTAHSVTVKLQTYQPIETGGDFLWMLGGAVDAWGANLSNNSFELIEAYSCGLGIRFAALYAPQINDLLAESTLCAVQLGGEGSESMEGISIETYHFESVFFSVIDYASCSGAYFGIPSNLQGDDAGEKFTKVIRLSPAGIISGVWTPQPISPRGITFKMDGGFVEFREPMQTRGKSLGGLTNHGGLRGGNLPADKTFETVYTESGFDISLVRSISLANRSPIYRNFRCHIYGDGTAGSPTENIYIGAAATPGVTLNGGSSVVIEPGVGAIDLECQYEPPEDEGPDGNWYIHWSRITSDYVAPPTAPHSGLQAMPLDPLSLSPNCWFDPSQANSTYQDTGTSTPAGNGDPVGDLRDLSGNGHHATQATSGLRPTKRILGGLTYLEGDGAGKLLETNSITQGQPFTMAAAILPSDDLTGIQTFLLSTGSVTCLQGYLDEWRAYAGISLPGGERDNSARVLIGVFNGASSKLYLDGYLIAEGDFGDHTIAATLQVALSKGAWFCGGSFPSALTETQIAGINAYMSAIAGKA